MLLFYTKTGSINSMSHSFGWINKAVLSDYENVIRRIGSSSYSPSGDRLESQFYIINVRDSATDVLLQAVRFKQRESQDALPFSSQAKSLSSDLKRLMVVSGVDSFEEELAAIKKIIDFLHSQERGTILLGKLYEVISFNLARFDKILHNVRLNSIEKAKVENCIKMAATVI